ncbi:MAG TPA: hypothetical protein VL100_05775, partial [Croceibacterium sp.]|nr:hypothetical protein [Croceibacterium sp.]
MSYDRHRHSDWKIIRLELARTAEFPEGSPSRALILRLPLADDGLIDADEVGRNPAQATVKRLWPDEPDQQGYVIRTGATRAFSYAIGDDDDEDLFHLEAHPLRPGEYVTLTEPNGEQLPFRVTRIAST